MDSHMDGSAFTRFACCSRVKAGNTAQGNLSLGKPVAVLLSRAPMDYEMPAMADRDHSRHKNLLEFSRTANEMPLIGLYACATVLNG